MESIKEENVKLSREVVTTVPNTWLVEATNPATGQTKMIDIANYAAVVAGVMNTKSVLSLTGKAIALSNEKGSYIKIARLTHSPSSRLVAMITATRVEFSPHANVAILDISARTNAMDSFLHSIIGSKLVNVYYIDNGEYIDVYASADMTYSRIGVLPLLKYATELTIGSIETISSNAISVEYT